MGRNYRGRRGSGFGSVVADFASLASKFGPTGTMVLGLGGFTIFYFLLPAALCAWADYNKSKMTGLLAPIFGQLLDELFIRRFIHPAEWAGIAILLICLAIAIWKLLCGTNMSRDEQRSVTGIGKFLARFLD